MAAGQAPNNPPVPADIWATFVGDINAGNAAQLIKGLTTVATQGTKRVHILFQSWGANLSRCEYPPD